MADMSLDDYMGKNNFKVQFQNTNVQKNSLSNQKMFSQNFGLSTKKNMKGFQNKIQRNFEMNRQKMGMQGRNNMTPGKPNRPLTGVSNMKSFDARQKLSGNKLTNNNAGLVNDARQKIITSQKQRGTFDARSRIKTKPAYGNGQNASTDMKNGNNGNPVKLMGAGGIVKTVRSAGGVQIGSNGGLTKTIRTGGGVQLGGLGGLKKTMKNEFANGGSQVEMYGNSIQITRSVPNTQISFAGGNKLTITKKASAIKDTQPVKRSRSPIQWSSNDLTSPSPPKRSNMIKTYKTADAIQRAAGKAASERLRISPTSLSSPKSTIPVITSTRKEAVVPKRKAPPVKVATRPVSPPSPSPQPVRTKTKSVYRPVTVKQEEPEIDIVPTSRNFAQNENVDQLLSPLQGYKVTVSNLDSGVTQDDLIELFGAIGALKRAKISRPGIGEVVYVRKEDAQTAAIKYHNRELDGLPMQVKLVTPLAARIQQATQDEEPSPLTIPDTLKFPKPSKESSIVEVPLIHRALFKTGTTVSTKPVTFTVKI